MKKTFILYILFLLYLEIVFHIACFREIDFYSIVILFFVTIVVSGILSFVTSLFKNEKINTIVMRTICLILSILFIAELIYFSIYESFFSFSGIKFAGALKDGYDKILLTIFQNILYVILFLGPTIIFMVKMPKPKKMNFSSCVIVLCFCILGYSYFAFFVNFINKDASNSLYSLMYKKNLPIENVKKMGLITSTSISLNRKVFGFNPKVAKSEDILINKRTVLADSLNIKYNVDDNIDFDSLISNESNETIKYLHNYFYDQTPTEQNDYTGMFKNKNVIFIMAESFDEIAIDQNLTPTLYKLKNEGIIFNNYFSPKYPAGTADGEYMLEWGNLPVIGEDYSLIDLGYNTDPYLLPRMLKTNGYKTYVYHNYLGSYNYRSSYFGAMNLDGHRYCQDGLNMRCEFFHGSDMDMMDQSIDDYINHDKFYAYYITLSGHGSYDSSNFVAEKHIDKVRNLNYSAQIKYYLAANIDFDLAMNKLITKLEEANKLDDTLIVISSDHSPYYLSNYEMNTISKIDRDNKFDRNRGSLIIYNPKLKEKHKVVDKYAMNIDVLPTVLNLLGVKYDSRLIIGKDILAHNNEGIVIFADRSWINNKGSYDASTSSFNGFTSVDPKYVTKINNELNEKYNVSTTMQYSDYLKYIFK